MTGDEIRELCINSSKIYYDYLAKTGKGLHEVDVWQVEVLDRVQRIVSLRLSKKIFDAETIFFQFEGDEQKYNTEQVKVLEYDVDRNILYVEPNSELFQRFSRIRAAEVKVISDMKFLVDRVRNWYEQRGKDLMLPTRASALDKKLVTTDLFGKAKPSQDQLNAIRTVLTKPFSYIWGAPGTGKTQLVLANVVNQYVKQGKRCAILAPTNTALEQVMKGVLRVSDEVGIPREKFLRLGHTSKWFAERYPEVCETLGIATQRMQIEKQIKVVRSVLKKEKSAEDRTIELLEEAVGKLDRLKDLLETSSTQLKSQKLMKQLLKEAKAGIAAHPLTKMLNESLDFESIEPSIKYLRDFIEKQKQAEAVLQARAREYETMQESDLKLTLDQLEQSRDKMKGSNERAKRALVVAATLDCYINRFIEDELLVDHFFLDEAGYANAIKAMVLMKGDVPVTFLGDHLQLPPVCEMNDMDMMQDPMQRDAFVWGKSAIYLPRLFDQGSDEAAESYFANEEQLSKNIFRADLRYTHRFGDNLANVLNDFVYKNGFASDSGKGETEIYFVHVDTPNPQMKDERNKALRESSLEAEAIRQFIQVNGLADYAILTPYINQVKLLGKLLPRDRNEGRIMTVHGAQGKEWENVLLSVVDTDRKWFTDSMIAKSRGLHLLNTAVSRAQRRLIIFCNSNYWKKQNGQLIKGLLDVAQPWPLLN